MKMQLSKIRVAILVIVSPFMMFALSSSVRASTAYGTLNNFDCVNDTGTEAHGFEIELDDIHCTDITYTYDYNHYGIPKITEDNSDPAHPKVFIRYAARRNPDGTWTAFTAIPSGPINPTNGHQFTNPSVNFGGEHFGAGYYGAPSAVKYNWLIDDGTGNLIHGPPVYVATPTFTYYPPAAQQPAQVQAVIVPPPPPDPPVLQFGEATWVKDIKTTTHNPGKVELRDLVDPDPDDPEADNWTNGEPAEVETEWRILQTEFADPGNPKGELAGIPEDLPDGDEVITRRYEFYKYIGPLDAESGEAMGDEVGPDGIHGIGNVTYNDHFDPGTGEWVEVTIDLSTVEVVGEFFGAQMAGFDVAPALGLIDHIPDGELGVPYADRTVVVAGGAAFLATVTGSPPDGTTLDELTGIFSGTPTVAGVFTFTVAAADTGGAAVSKTYTVTIPEALADISIITTSASPAEGGSTTGDGVYDDGTPVTVIATHNPGYDFVSWTEGGVEVSISAVYPFTVSADRILVANFLLVDACPDDPDKIDPGICGCGFPDEDADGDGTVNCLDGCPDDPNKIDPGVCGCGAIDEDTDGDGVLDCNDVCPGQDDNPDCQVNGTPDCLEINQGTSIDWYGDGIPDECQAGVWTGAGSDAVLDDGNWDPWGVPGVNAVLMNTGGGSATSVLYPGQDWSLCQLQLGASGGGQQILRLDEGSRCIPSVGTLIDAGGEVMLRGGELGGGEVSNASNTITGYGVVSADVDNSGLIEITPIRIMEFTGAGFANQPTGMLRALVGSGVRVSATNLSQQGEIEVQANASAVFDSALTNSFGGMIRLYNGALGSAGLTNAVGAMIHGAGTIQSSVANHGDVIVIASTMIAGDLDNTGTVTLQGGFLTITGDLSGDGTILGGFGGRDGGADATGLLIRGNLDLSTRDWSQVDLTSAIVQMAGDPARGVQTLEAPAADCSSRSIALPDASLFSIGTLRIGPLPTTVRLVDRHRNSLAGRRSANVPEVLYVKHLILDPGVTLDLAGLRLYYETVTPRSPLAGSGVYVVDSVGDGGLVPYRDHRRAQSP